MLTLKKAAILASAIGLGVAVGAPAQAAPGFYLTVHDVTTPQADFTGFYAGLTASSTGAINFGGYTFGLQVDSNWPGGVTLGTLSTQISFSGSGTGSLHHLTFDVFVSDDATPTVKSLFTAPIGPDYKLTGSGSAQGNLSVANLTMTATNFLNATALVSGPVNLPNFYNQSINVPGAAYPYTLENFIDLSNATSPVGSGGWSGIVLQNTESVERVPEPVSIALVGAGIAGLGLVRRRRAK